MLSGFLASDVGQSHHCRLSSLYFILSDFWVDERSRQGPKFHPSRSLVCEPRASFSMAVSETLGPGALGATNPRKGGNR